MDLAATKPLFESFKSHPRIAMSHNQRAALPGLNWLATIHHGLPKEQYSFQPQNGKYLVFLGRICKDKGIEDAIAIAESSGMHLKIAGSVDAANIDYFNAAVKPHLSEKIEFIGEVGDSQKSDLLGNAYALLFPIKWREPFGLVLIEAMSCGTPVIAYDDGAVREIIQNGMTGFICNGIEEAAQSIEKIASLSRQTIRLNFEQCFSAERMAHDHVSAYKTLLQKEESKPNRIYINTFDIAKIINSKRRLVVNG
jgi:glycosyltransferase involved in cell wall biosynthesis